MARSKNAVILIQGMGEQMPMDTLRDFVGTVVQPPTEKSSDEVLYNKTDRLSDGTDMRRLTLKGNRNRPTTDFFEYYWTPEFAPGRVLGVLRFAAKYLKVPYFKYEIGSTRHIVAWSQCTILLGLLLVALIFASPGFIGGILGSALWWRLTLSGIVVLLGVLAMGFLWHFSRSALSDVLRYFSPTPRDTRARDAIRRRGVEMVLKLHADDSYERIIVVGHSLGSVIAYDILRIAWDELRYVPDGVSIGGVRAAAANHQAVLLKFDDDAEKLLGKEKHGEFQRLQMRLAKENNELGMGWRVTDFVTLGSPLSHGVVLLGNKRYSLAEKMTDREFPVCPPLPDAGSNKSFYRFDEPVQSTERYWVPNSSATFGPTLWTNIYFPTNRFLNGDPVGGPIAPIFGSGIKDVPVRLSYNGWPARILRAVPLWSHTKYWARQAGTFDGLAQDRLADDEATGTKDAVPALKSALRL